MKRKFERSMWTLIILVVAFIPTWIWLASRTFMSPTGFWQELALAGCSMFFLGGLQLILLVVGLAFIVQVWDGL